MTDRSSLLDSLAKPPPPPSELDELMSRDPLNLSALDIDKIIQYQRAARAQREGGAKPKRSAKEAGVNSAVDLVALVKGTITPPTAPTPTLKPAGGGFRRL